MAIIKKKFRRDTKSKGLTQWVKGKLFGKDTEKSPVDTQFIADLVDIKTVGRYEIVKKIGQGSMGVVYLGKDPYINRKVGIKVSRPASDAKGKIVDKYRERFFLEAQSAGRLMHPNIVAIYDAGLYKDFCYITMEYINGPTLVNACHKDFLFPISKVASIVFHVCGALDYAHQKGVVHRDIKPSNIMLTKNDEVKITDFGIAKIMTEQTLKRGIVGSPSYMSPEQVKEMPINHLSDIFALGCVFYELIAGQKAFPGENYFSIMYKITNEDPKPIRQVRPDIPPILEQIITKALEKDPDKRYQSCMDIAYELRVAVRGLKEGDSKGPVVGDVVDYVHSVQFFEGFSKEQVGEILEASNVVKIPRGNVMVTEGDIDDSFFIILSGRAVVQRNGKDIASIKRGECFGEMAFLTGESRTATVVADTECILMKISAILLDKSPESVQLLFLKRFAITLLRRLSVSNIQIDQEP